MLKQIIDTTFIILQFLLPKHLLSRLVAHLAESKIGWLKNILIRLAIDVFGINMSEAISENPEDYASFNDFFTRELRPGIRPIEKAKNILCSPCDGLISQSGPILNSKLIQAKGHDYQLIDLLAGKKSLSNQFENGQFATIYLSPKDYHRIHMPCDGELSSSIYVPGELFSVNKVTANNIDRLFARNERLINIFQTDKGPVAVILVGAMLVAGIETVWGGQIAPPKEAISTFESSIPEKVKLLKGEELGRFKFGSTVILLFPEGMSEWEDYISPDLSIKMGESIATFSK